jgi:diguanylate cyclase (GGDEF)-like protein
VNTDSRPDVILVAEDDPNIRHVLSFQLESAGYKVLPTEDGEQALQLLERETPDLVILDVMMPRLDGYATCRRIRAQRRLNHIPVIFLSAKDTTDARVEGLVEGANDYLPKPYSQAELLLRVKNLLQWSRMQRESNPLTGLPGNRAIESEVQHWMSEGRPFAFMYVDLDHFKAYNDFYGYRAGDDVIRYLANVLAESIEEAGDPSDFVGHVGGDDFVVISVPGRAEAIAETIIRRFKAHIPEYYRPVERARGYVEVESRRHSRIEKFPLLSLTIALVESDRYHIEHLAMLNDLVSELKRHGKQIPGNVVVKDRRQPTAEHLRTGSDG